MKNTVVNAMSFDVEDYFQVSAFEATIKQSDWERLEPRVEVNTNKILELLERHNAKATFFILGWVAERFPQLVRRIVDAKHEVASHGMLHQKATAQSQRQFSADVEDSKKLLEDLSGVAVTRYRAPRYSFLRSNQWVYEALANAGYRYSSSVYPVQHDHYGIPDAPRFNYMADAGILEIPLSTARLMNRNFPISGGGFFRLYPYAVTKKAIRNLNEKEQKPYIFYLHPWELDPNQPRVSNAPLKSRFRHYLNLDRVESRLTGLLQDFSWSSMEKVFVDGLGEQQAECSNSLAVESIKV